MSTTRLFTSLAICGFLGCGGINVAPPPPTADVAAPVACSTDADCKGDQCRTATCDASTKQCVYTMQAGYCFIGGACVLENQQRPGDLCSVCDPASTTEVYVALGCGAGQTCEPTKGCVEVLPDVLADTTIEETSPDVPDEGVDAPDAADDGGGPIACSTNADCKGKLPTAPCEAALCVADTCAVATLPTGSACTPEGGKDLACSGGKCDDSGACIGELLSNVGCDDGSACTLGDVCQDGDCVGVTKDCSDGNPCTTDSCDAATGTCDWAAIPDGGVATPCEDGNLCTENDECSLGECMGGANVCACTTDADCPDDGNKCNGASHCVDKACEIDPSTIVTCPVLDDGACQPACVPATGLCEVVAGQPCDDADPCTFTDKCGADGACAGSPMVCDDGNVCTTDACSAGACVNTANASPCDDGDPCTEDDVCAASACAGAAKSCGDGNPCTADSCQSGACVNEALLGEACDDDNACTEADTCGAGACNGTALACNDGNPCTDDACDPGTGCTYTANSAPCSDGNPCTVGDSCSAKACAAGSGALNCPAGGSCTVGACDPATGCKVQSAKDGAACEDGNTCTAGDTCQGGTCAAGTNTCECTTDAMCASADLCSGVHVCTANKCTVKPGTAVVCPSSTDPCLTNQCVPATGACKSSPANEGKSCAADTACATGQVCTSGACVGTTTICPKKQCNVVSGCDPKDGCLYTFTDKGQPCDDGDKCTDQDNCNSIGECVGLAAKCDDGNPCTLDSCKAGVGCIGTAVSDGTSCEGDSNLCTKDVCTAGTCTPSATKVCDDGVTCTINGCDKTTGSCTYTPDNTACDDGNPCTADTCLATGCSSASVADFTTCSDGSVATAPDFCFQGSCAGGVVSAVAPAKSLCTISKVAGVDIAQTGADFFVAGNYATGSWSGGICSSAVAYTAVYRLTGDASLQTLGAAKGSSYAMADKVVVGTDIGLVDTAAGTVSWSSKLESAMGFTSGTLLTSAGFTHTYTGKSSQFDHWMIAGYTPGSLNIPFASRCSHALSTDTWTCSSPTFDSSVGSTKGLAYFGATLSTGSCSPFPCIGTSIGGNTLAAWHVTSGSLLLNGDSSNKQFLGLKVAAGSMPAGSLQESSTVAWHYGSKDFLYRCTEKGCTLVDAPQKLGYWEWFGGFAYSGGVVLLGLETKSGDAKLVFIAAGADTTDAASYQVVTIQDAAETTSMPGAVMGTTTTGIYVLGQNYKASSYTVWSFLK